MRYLLITVILIGFMPLATQAAITINEIAWMGDAESPNHEWIELYNDDESVSVDDWTLSDGNNINITLSGTILAGAYAVLERTSEESAPGAAFVIYTGALNNTGATLTLIRDDGGIEDQVSGGEDWESLGGNNETKETAQYTVNGWITAEPTPGTINKTEQNIIQQISKTSPSTGAQLAEPVEREPVVLKLPGITLDLEVISQEQVFVNQPVEFDVIPTGVGDTIKNSLQYSWNFGDMGTANEKNPTHTFSYPGTYVVHTSAEYARQHAEVSKEITVLPVMISLTTNKQGDVQINNDSPYDIDLSGYRLRGKDVVTVPQNTKLVSRQTITVPNNMLAKTDHTMVGLYDAVGQLVASVLPDTLKPIVEEVVLSAANTNQVRAAPKITVPNDSFQFVSEAQAATVSEVEEDTLIVTETDIETESGESQVSSDEGSFNWTVIALVVLLSLSSIVVLIKPLNKTGGLDKYE